MNAEIVSIGTELLLGEISDTNATWIARQLRDIGINLFYITAVGDNEDRIAQTLERALGRSDLVITTGGLGPTVDDMTRQGVAQATGRPLVFHQNLLDDIARRFEQFGVPMTENNRQQAFAPEGAILVPNPVGTAPCFIVETETSIILSLPGVPREMKYLMEKQILPYLRQKMGLPAIIKARVLHTAGMGESMVDEHVKDLMRAANPTVGLAAHSGRTDIRITARAHSEAEADAMIAPLEALIRERLGKFIYGADAQDDLQAALNPLLQAKNLRLVLVEVGLGEGLSKLTGSLNDKLVLNYAQLGDLQAAHGLTPGGGLKAQAEAALQQILLSHPGGVGILVILESEGRAALAIQSGHKSYSREIELGNEAEASRWGLNWCLGYLWRQLQED
jgi:nicotinamide-nucleotide amidase